MSYLEHTSDSGGVSITQTSDQSLVRGGGEDIRWDMVKKINRLPYERDLSDFSQKWRIASEYLQDKSAVEHTTDPEGYAKSVEGMSLTSSLYPSPDERMAYLQHLLRQRKARDSDHAR